MKKDSRYIYKVLYSSSWIDILNDIADKGDYNTIEHYYYDSLLYGSLREENYSWLKNKEIWSGFLSVILALCLN